MDDQDAPALDTVFGLIAPTDKWINCDLKEPDLENAVIDLARGHGLLQRLIFSGTVSLERVRTDESLRRDVLIYINIEELMPGLYDRLRDGAVLTGQDMQKAADLCKSYGLSVINVYEKLCTPEFMQVMEQNGIAVSAWTINDPERAAAVARAKCTENITSRAPELVRGAIDS